MTKTIINWITVVVLWAIIFLNWRAMQANREAESLWKRASNVQTLDTTAYRWKLDASGAWRLCAYDEIAQGDWFMENEPKGNAIMLKFCTKSGVYSSGCPYEVYSVINFNVIRNDVEAMFDGRK